MKVSYNWLKELLPDLTLNPAEVAQELTLHSFETVVAYSIEVDSAITVAKILAVEPHPNADRLQVVTIDTKESMLKVVCGAKNFKVGDVVPYSPPGAQVVDEAGERFEVKTATIRGVESPGMLNSLRELGLGSSHAGLFILPADTPIGSKLKDHIPDDIVLEADITPNRAHDAASHVGIARELAALQKIIVQEPLLADLKDIPSLPNWQIEAEISQTSRYSGFVLNNITIAPSPLWLQSRLLVLGARPINNVVDITNYIVWEIGNPTHAFDVAKLPSTTMRIRPAVSDESLKTLDGKEHVLSSEVLIIANGEIPIAVAGVIGGSATEVDDTTQAIFLEVATFDPTAVRRSSDSLQTRTDSSIRFSKGLAPALVDYAGARALQLFQELAGATIKGRVEYYPSPQKPHTVEFDPARVSKIAGMPITDDMSLQALVQLRCKVTEKDSVWQVEVPGDRLDLEGPHDLAEEVIRCVGLDRIPVQEPAAVAIKSLPPGVRVREFFRDELTAAGMTEVYSYSFEDEPFAKELNLLDDQALTVSNPIAPEQAKLRTSLLPGLLKVLKKNRMELQKPFRQIEKAFFEVGHVYWQGNNGKVPGVIEEEHIAVAALTTFDPQQFLNALLEKLGAVSEEITVEDGIVKYKESILGRTFTYSVSELPFLHSLRANVTAFELSLDILGALNLIPPESWQPIEIAKKDTQYQEFSRYPSVLRDISLLVDPAVTPDQAQEIIERVGGQLVADTELFDEFLPAEMAGTPPLKGLAFHVEYQAQDHTLSTPEIEPIHNRIIKALEAELGAEIR